MQKIGFVQQMAKMKTESCGSDSMVSWDQSTFDQWVPKAINFGWKKLIKDLPSDFAIQYFCIIKIEAKFRNPSVQIPNRVTAIHTMKKHFGCFY